MSSSPPPNATLTTYRNPVLPGWNAQPSVCNVPGKGYFVASSSASFVPAVPVYHSTDLFTWELVGHAIHDSPGEQRGVEHLRESSATAAANGSNGAAASSSSRASGARASISGFAPPKCRNYPTRNGGYWSPCLRYHGGQWYVVVVYEREDGKSRLLITSTRDIFDTHSWTTPVEVEDLSGREPDLFFDAGKAWLSYTPAVSTECEPQVLITPIDPDTGKLLGNTVVMYTGAHNAARLLKCAGWYYLILDDDIKASPDTIAFESAGTLMFRSRTHPASGAFIHESEPCPHNPVLFNSNHAQVRGTSRLSLVRGERGWTAIFHGIRGGVDTKGGFAPLALGHETYMANAAWKDGWPVINDNLAIGVTGDAESMRWLPEADEFEDGFDGELSYVWSSSNATLSTSPAANLTISSVGGDAEMVLRQQSVAVDFETELDTSALAGMAGIVVRVGDKYAKLGLRAGEAVHEVDGRQTIYPLPPSSRIHKLRILARPGSHELQLDGDGDSEGSSLRVSLPLTPGHGAMMGVFATTKARFVRAGWRRLEAEV